ncbi:MAG: transposase [Candidatus Pacebacteria bacterium]|nr:transposase [Candidatus Paceibacterota bacterium]
MPSKKTQLVNGEYYHVYNRGVDKRMIFQDEKDYFKFLRNLKDFNNNSYYEQRIKELRPKIYKIKERGSFILDKEKTVSIVAYSLLPNHFHLILKQLTDKGISNFMHKIGTSFTNHFNKKHDRSGYLFQGPYKAVHINNDDYLLWLSGYINSNVEIHGIEKAENYKWSSYDTFLGKRKNKLLGDIDIVLSRFKNSKEYENYVDGVIEQSKNRKGMIKKEKRKYLLEQL